MYSMVWHGSHALISARSEKHELTEQARTIIKTIRQMEAALDDNKTGDDFEREDDELKVTYPLNQCLEHLKRKHQTISRLHRDRYEQVKSTDGPTHSGYLTMLTRWQNSPKP